MGRLTFRGRAWLYGGNRFALGCTQGRGLAMFIRREAAPATATATAGQESRSEPK
jgi:hypothetical protein